MSKACFLAIHLRQDVFPQHCRTYLLCITLTDVFGKMSLYLVLQCLSIDLSLTLKAFCGPKTYMHPLQRSCALLFRSQRVNFRNTIMCNFRLVHLSWYWYWLVLVLGIGTSSTSGVVVAVALRLLLLLVLLLLLRLLLHINNSYHIIVILGIIVIITL